MHVGYGLVFQNPNNQLSDREVWRNEIRLAEMAEPLGFDSIWSIEHRNLLGDTNWVMPR